MSEYWGAVANRGFVVPVSRTFSQLGNSRAREERRTAMAPSATALDKEILLCKLAGSSRSSQRNLVVQTGWIEQV